MKSRNIGIDILRIISMYQIIMLHFLNLGGTLRTKAGYFKCCANKICLYY